MKRLLLNLLVALSLANVTFMPVWNALLSSTGFFVKGPPGDVHLIAAVCDVILVGTCFLLLLTFADRSDAKKIRKLVTFGLTIPLIVPVVWLLRVLHLLPSLGEWWPIATAALLLAVTMLAPDNLLLRLTRIHRGVLYVLSPFLIVTLPQAIVHGIVHGPEKEASSVSLSQVAAGDSTHKNRIVWLLFDELDQRMTFVSRYRDVHLPELDRLRAESIFATQAHPPAGKTILSVPSLLEGRFIVDFQVTTEDMILTASDSQKSLSFRDEPTVFTDAKQAGIRTGVVGWYLPYCKLFKALLSACSWQPDEGDPGLTWPDMSLRSSMLHELKEVVKSVPSGMAILSTIYREGTLRRTVTLQYEHEKRRKHSHSYLSILKDAKQIVARPDLGLVFLHWPIPHAPSIFDRHTKSFSVSPENGYLDNLVLVDQTLGAMRETMVRAGVWDSSIVLVTSDHWWRVNTQKDGLTWTSEEATVSGGVVDPRVPFLLKLPHQNAQVLYEKSFNTVVLRELLMQLATGQLATPKDVTDWLDLHGQPPTAHP